MLFCLPKKGLYYFDKIDTNKVNICYAYQKNSNFVRIMRKIDFFMIKTLFFIPGVRAFNKFICKKSYDKRLIESLLSGENVVSLDSHLCRDFFFLIKSYKIKNYKLIIWNHITDKMAKYFSNYISKDNIFIYSKLESKKYGFQYTNDFCLRDYPIKKSNLEYDVYFMGTDKGRAEIINGIAKALINNSINAHFDIYDESNRTSNYINYFRDYKSFDEYMDNVMKSKCLLDVVNTKNITFRTIESFMFKKKLITNNAELKAYDFYNPNNIYIIDDVTNINIDEIKKFLSTPLVEVEDRIIEQYDFYYTYNKFKRMFGE